MDKKKIPTGIWIAMIVIIAITVSVLTWKYEKNVPSLTQSSLTTELNQQEIVQPTNDWKKYKDDEYGYELDYPSNWNITQRNPSKNNVGTTFIFSTNGPMNDGSNGTIILGKYSIYNSSLTNSIENNLKLLNSKINIADTQSTFKEIPIIGGRAFYNLKQTSISPKEREIFIIGKNVIFNGTFQTSSSNIDMEKLDEFTEILSKFKFLQ